MIRRIPIADQRAMAFALLVIAMFFAVRVTCGA